MLQLRVPFLPYLEMCVFLINEKTPSLTRVKLTFFVTMQSIPYIREYFCFKYYTLLFTSFIIKEN